VKVLWIEADQPQEINTSIFRARIPAFRLKEAGHECALSHFNHLQNIPRVYRDAQLYQDNYVTHEALKWADVVVIERLITKEIHTTIKWLRSIGKQVWATFDDAYHLMPVGGSHSTWRGGDKALQGRGDILGEFRQGLSLCTGVIVPSKVLVADYKQYNPNTHFIPNYLLGKNWENPLPKNPDNLVIGWGGSSAHNVSFSDSGIIPALAKLCAKYPKLYVHIQSRDPRILSQFDKVGVRYKAFDWVKYEEWCRIVGGFDVGVAMLSGAYDKRRSALKVQEYAMAGVPWVATDDAPYQIGCKGGILIPNKQDAWFKTIEKLLLDATLYNRLEKEGKAWATEFNNRCVPDYERVFGISQKGT